MWPVSLRWARQSQRSEDIATRGVERWGEVVRRTSAERGSEAGRQRQAERNCSMEKMEDKQSGRTITLRTVPKPVPTIGQAVRRVGDVAGTRLDD